MTFLQAFIDDSASDVGEQRLFMAGFLQQAKVWEQFSDEWVAGLAATPSIKYFKSVEAGNSRGEFRGWNRAAIDAKVVSLAAILNRFKPISFYFSIPRRIYFDNISPVSPRGISPHFSCSLLVMSGVANYCISQDIRMPVDFVFDEQNGVSDDILLLFEHIKSSFPARMRAILRRSPSFEDDRKVVALQASDMLAWHIRREYEGSLSDASREVLGYINRIGFCYDLSTSEVLRWQSPFAEMYPVIKKLQTKGQWKMVKSEIARLNAAGFRPPASSKLLEIYNSLVEFLKNSGKSS